MGCTVTVRAALETAVRTRLGTVLEELSKVTGSARATMVSQPRSRTASTAPAIVTILGLIDEERAAKIERRCCPTGDRWAAGYPTDGDVEAAALALRAIRAGRPLAAFGAYEIIEDGSGDVVGGIGFHGPPRQDGSVEVGYSVAYSRQRRGYATAALLKMVQIAEDAGAQLLEARAAPANAASRRVLEKAGFSYRDLADGYVRYACRSRSRSGADPPVALRRFRAPAAR